MFGVSLRSIRTTHFGKLCIVRVYGDIVSLMENVFEGNVGNSRRDRELQVADRRMDNSVFKGVP